ncbi:YlbE family protein [Actinoplanes xinjiangensis]|uniref:Uncharacterized protein DUF1116 n=1 Tax=Actinoplanes xinjiangensis TaxID=512350 RepID=A0A316EW82_9ACTN|nr:DUF1116 domain-containing protein [Actinoplanes xinjiangensis]PWK36095.1 uncharacterized protein DUF1116 [Actinoplanes xinjiangensis]GIF42901.1 hypothetical protein Axi01nite_72120 [Actinoplanes xinjiangensis]
MHISNETYGVEHWDAAQVSFTRIERAATVCPDLGPRTFLHAGPPIEAGELPGPTRSALIGALLLERQADTPSEAARLLDKEALTLMPGHDFNAVGPMTGIISASTPVVVATDSAGRTAFSPLSEGAGRCLRFGSHDERTIQRIRWILAEALPVINSAFQGTSLNISRIIRSALEHGDECHSRSVAATNQFLIQFLAGAVRNGVESDRLTRVFRWMNMDAQFFGTFTMAAARILADSVHGVPGSPVVTAIAANGCRVGIRVSGLGDRWFTADAPVGHTVLFSGFDPGDVLPIMGDSCVTEVVGLGALSLPASPVVAAHLGLDIDDVRQRERDMERITVTRSGRYRLPMAGFPGIPQGIDVRRVIDASIVPMINTGLVHRDPAIGQIGAGLAPIPLSVFQAAAAALVEATRSQPAR